MKGLASVPAVGKGWPSNASLRQEDFQGMLDASSFADGFNPYGKALYVDGNQGQSAGTGLSHTSPMKYMTDAFAKLESGDAIFFRGNIREELSTPAGVFDVSIIGVGNRPRHADAHTSNNGYSAATWKPPASPTTATPLLIVRQQGWRFGNFLMDCPVDAAGIQLLRDAASGDSERDASHAEFHGVRFESGLVGIQNNGGAGFVEVNRCRFTRMSGSGAAGIKCTSTTVAVPLEWQIRNSFFMNNASHILSSMSYSEIVNNRFGRFTATLSIDIDDQPSANQGEYNIITGNYLYGTYSATAYPPGSNNEWAGNVNVLSGGFTAADPA